jgi:ADP-glucose pyrophosphorylase
MEVFCYREIPLMISAAGSSSLWTPVAGYLVKEQSVVGEGTVIAEKGTIKQCTVGGHCNIGTRTKLNNSVIMEGANVGEG